ncbi:MAG: NrdJb [Pseudomonadota bacterium]
MSVKIEKKIVGYDVVKTEDDQNAAKIDKQAETKSNTELDTGSAKIVQMHEKVVRPEMLIGSTYKIKTPVSEHAFYITINDMVLNPDTPYEKRRPFEIFINSKNMDHYQWISGLTLIISAVFRKGGDVTFLVKELQSVFDPKGGYFKKGGKFMPSLVAEIGDAIENHLKMIGMIVDPGLDEHQQKLVEEKRAEYESRQSVGSANATSGEFPAGASLCNKCNVTAMVLMDGCMTCLNCGDSKCG